MAVVNGDAAHGFHISRIVKLTQLQDSSASWLILIILIQLYTSNITLPRCNYNIKGCLTLLQDYINESNLIANIT